MEPNQLAAVLDGNPWIRQLHHADPQILASYFRCFSVAKDQPVFMEGARQAFLCLIVDGQVDIVKRGRGHEQKHLVTLKAGEVFGEMSLIDKSERSATAIARRMATLLILSEKKFETLLAEHPNLGLDLVTRIARDLSSRLRNTSGCLVDYLGKTTDEAA